MKNLKVKTAVSSNEQDKEHVCQLMLRTRTLGQYTKKTQKEKTIYSAKYFELLTKKNMEIVE